MSSAILLSDRRGLRMFYSRYGLGLQFFILVASALLCFSYNTRILHQYTVNGRRGAVRFRKKVLPSLRPTSDTRMAEQISAVEDEDSETEFLGVIGVTVTLERIVRNL